MIRLTWDDIPLDVQRLVVRRDLPAFYLREVRRVALRHGLFVVSPEAMPQPGDFWLGCSPEKGWGDADPQTVGWANLFELETALEALRDVAEARRPVAVI